jgi:hypothetical protein
MSRRRLGLAVVVLLTVAGLGLAATTVDTAESNTGGASVGGIGSGDGAQTGDDQRLLSLVLVALVAVVLASTLYTLLRGEFPWEYLLVIVVATALVLVLILAGQFFAGGTSTPEPAADRPNDSAAPSVQTTETPQLRPGGDDAGDSSAPMTLGALFALLFVGALAVVWFSTGREPAPAPGDAEEETQAAVAAAAGRAVDELDASSLSNGIYRAWHEMTDALDVERPETTTPAEFEDIAVDAGLRREDVRALTDLFREVRYGDAEATAAREQRAREALRRIEETYADDEREDDGGEQP